MNVIQIPPSGVPAHFPIEVPAPEGMTTLGGIRVYFLFQNVRPDVFVPKLYEGDSSGAELPMMDSASGQKSLTRISQFQEARPAPMQVVVSVNEGGSLEPGNTVTIYAWGAQTESGTGALNPDEGGEPSVMTDTIEVGQVEILTWPEWNRLTGENQKSPGGQESPEGS
jgi:hypothetical protein